MSDDPNVNESVTDDLNVRDSAAWQTTGPGGAGAIPDCALSNIRVLDIATFVAAPFCGTILGDFGAEVIKIEHPNEGDSLRRFGTRTTCGDTLVWLSEARNKKTITLNLKSREGAEIFCRLVAKSDVVLENFRPGTMEKWGIGFETLREVNPRIVMLRVSAYGQNGPKRDEPGFARIAHGFGGLTYLSGEPDGPPVVPGSTSLADYASGMWGAIGVLLALRHVQNGGPGQFIDIGLYESVFRLLDEMVPAYAKFGTVRQRMGADTVNVVPHSHYRAKGGEWLAIACTNDKMWQRIAAVMGSPQLGTDPEYATSAARVQRRAEVNRMVADWVGSLPFAEVIAQCLAGGVPCGPIYSVKDIFEDAQYRARANFCEVDDPRIGPITIPSPVPRLSETPARFRHTGRPLSADTDSVLAELAGVDPSCLARMRADGII